VIAIPPSTKAHKIFSGYPYYIVFPRDSLYISIKEIMLLSAIGFGLVLMLRVLVSPRENFMRFAVDVKQLIIKSS
jgi:hypothetical protein